MTNIYKPWNNKSHPLYLLELWASCFLDCLLLSSGKQGSQLASLGDSEKIDINGKVLGKLAVTLVV